MADYVQHSSCHSSLFWIMAAFHRIRRCLRYASTTAFGIPRSTDKASSQIGRAFSCYVHPSPRLDIETASRPTRSQHGKPTGHAQLNALPLPLPRPRPLRRLPRLCVPPRPSTSLTNGAKDVPGRFCGAVAGATCYLPCPLRDWVFDDAFMARVRALQRGAGPVSLAACAFLLLAWAVLPPAQSRRHYLSIGLTVSVLFVAVGFRERWLLAGEGLLIAVARADDPAGQTDPPLRRRDNPVLGRVGRDVRRDRRALPTRRPRRRRLE